MAPLLLVSLCLVLAVETLAFTWPYWTYNTVSFRPPKLDIIKTNDEPAPGLLFIGPKNNQIAGMLSEVGATSTIYDQEGNLVWQGPDIENTNLQVQTLFGEPVLTFWTGKKVEGYGYGVVHILDQTYREIFTVKLHGDFYTPAGVSDDSYIDLHESKITERNTMLVTSYNVTRVDASPVGGLPDTWALKSAFHEIEIGTNKVLFSWSPMDEPTRIPLSSSRADVPENARSPESPWDIYHINSVDDAANGYVVSLRHCFSTSYIGRNGTLDWHLDGHTGGDFDLCRSCTFSWQHDVRAYEETPDSLALSIFNNDGKEGGVLGNPTTGLVLGVNLRTMTVTEKRRLIDPNHLLNSDTQGSLQALANNDTTSGNMLVGYGSWATVKEFNARDELVWTARFGPDAQVASYRAFKFDWHATPYYPPAMNVKAYQSPSGLLSTHFYVSWNGATDVVRWNFYAEGAGNDSEPVFIASVPKTGFETPFIVEGYLDRVSVEGVHVNGTALGRSPMQRTELHGSWDDRNVARPVPDDPAVIAAAVASAPASEEDHSGDSVGKSTQSTNSDSDAASYTSHAPLASFFVCSMVAVLLGVFWYARRHKHILYQKIVPPRDV